MTFHCRRCDKMLGTNAGYRATLCRECKALVLSEAAKRGARRRRQYAADRTAWIHELHAEGLNAAAIAAKVGCSKRTVYYALAG